tara:strand:- start:71 stop:370 length:300 start_codon:yes stop_codon:yes gene_type:complete
MNTINKNKEELLKKLKQRLENSWSGFTQVVEEAEEFLEDIKEAEEKETIDYAETEDLNIFYEDYIDNLKYQAEVLQAETQQAIDKFEGMYNISYMKDEV